MRISRRTSLAMLGLLAGATALPARASLRRVERAGVQLYTLRGAMALDAAETLAAVAAAGYSEVEPAGTGNLNANQFAQALRDTGLTAPSAHVPYDLIKNKPEELLAMAQVIGCEYLVLPWLSPEFRSASGYGVAIDLLNRFGDQCHKSGVQLCYHNHDFEFERVDGEVAFDRLLRECDRDRVKFELDLFWVTHAGADGAAYLRADPQRYPLCHVKDRSATGEMMDVGQGVIDFAALFAAGSGVRHYFVEHDRPVDALASIITSIQALKRIRY
jgi:sugar phosphate isomerase/epimerase